MTAVATNTAPGYAEFIARKRRGHGLAGFDPDPGAVSSVLHDWQADITRWAIRKGRAAIFADCGMGKTLMQVEWARLMAAHHNRPSLIVAPLSVARQTVREAASKLGVEVTYTRDMEGVRGPGVWVTNYEMAHAIDPAAFAAVVLDESSILKNVDGKTRRFLTEAFAGVPARLACSATPAPNDVAELTNHAEYLGVMRRADMLAAYFIHDDEGWRLKGHATLALCDWIATWAVSIRRPSDFGYPDTGYMLPPLKITEHAVAVQIDSPGQLFPTTIGGVSGRSEVRKATLNDRVELTADLARAHPGQAIVWCGLNREAEEVAALLGPDAVNVDGAMPPEAKAATLEGFQDGTHRWLVTKPRIAGFGMNFQNAHRMIFCGIGDSYESYYQAIRRCWRYGQTSPVEVSIVVSELERQIAENVRRKEEQADTMTGMLVTASREHLKGGTDRER